ncbi:hypothetical protein BABINDRAFT_159928 [Babjeviella inositovora NRRL Y-12698]|uniref:Cytokinin riboside 5'-monophosphate phosphoribohydrolase n=1 Tax=Babjeviella inositovora NRRL Y-12698 TaxID=984486 RepID=A0A1E3QXC0_9ASCO|nr:uncharacterized protein BABINDRAFT_159928 [Babjeviella inositovora NRRL Y-12698]ODQ81667.1 hypothetical protein BABINDRAFT_159928 [Babjeviella inositovora NRRL Y-12698]
MPVITNRNIVTSNINDAASKHNPAKVVCVYCGSAFGNNPKFATEAAKLGELIASKNWGLVYGGGTTGLMGTVARGTTSQGGYVHGIIPQALIARERADTSIDEFNARVQETVDKHDGTTPVPEISDYGYTTVVSNMHLRKQIMAEEAEAFVALPGGYGTLEELMEVVTWSQLGIHQKPVVLFNMDGFYDLFMVFIKNAIKSGFISEKSGSIIVVANTAEEVISAIENYVVPEGRFKLNWDENISNI